MGSDEVESSYIPDPTQEQGEEEAAHRTIIFWRDGFSIEDGPLLRYDVPENASLLNDINAGFVSFADRPPRVLTHLYLVTSPTTF